MRTALLIAVGTLFLATPALAQYYYNPSFPNQPGSYNHAMQSAYNTALHSVAVTSVRDPGGNVWSGTPRGGAPGVQVVETPATPPAKTYKGLSTGTSTSAMIAQRLGVDASKVFVQTSDLTVRRASSIFSAGKRIDYRIVDGAGTVTGSGKLLMVQMKDGSGSRLFKASR